MTFSNCLVTLELPKSDRKQLRLRGRGQRGNLVDAAISNTLKERVSQSTD